MKVVGPKAAANSQVKVNVAVSEDRADDSTKIEPIIVRVRRRAEQEPLESVELSFDGTN